MNVPLVPGVYIQSVEVAAPTPVRLSVTGFVGQAERGPLYVPQRLTSWGQFRTLFGDFVGFSYLPYAVFGFFLNGGEQCYVVRVARQTSDNGVDDPHRLDVSSYLDGLNTFETVSDIGLIALPDLIIPDLYARIPPTQIPPAGIIFAPVPVQSLILDNLQIGQRMLLRHCEKMGDRFAILDAPRGAETGKGTNRIEDWPGNFLLPSRKHGALYYPWIQEKSADFGGRTMLIPPSGHIAGIYARTERERGVGKAPANEIVQGVVAIEFPLSDTEQSILNPKGVNCLRVFPGRGLRVWGARTMVQFDSPDAQWLYVNVRRVYLMIVKNILAHLQWTVFEPNDQRLRDKIVATLTLFLRELLQSATLAGTKPEEAFFVQCDEETNPPEVVDRGEVVTRIGFAPARPAEFILVTIRRTAEALTVSTQTV